MRYRAGTLIATVQADAAASRNAAAPGAPAPAARRRPRPRRRRTAAAMRRHRRRAGASAAAPRGHPQRGAAGCARSGRARCRCRAATPRHFARPILGLKVTLIERWPVLGGVCLNVGCIPSKALLHAAKVIEDAADMAACGIVFGPPQIDRDRLRAWKNRVVDEIDQRTHAAGEAAQGGSGSRRSEIHRTVLAGSATATSGARRVDFKQCIIAAGSESVRLPGFPDDPRVIDSTGALELPLDCKRLLVIGGGIIGLEMACVYDALGVQRDRGRIERRLDAGHRSRSGAPAAEAHRKALRDDFAQDQGRQARGRCRRDCARRSTGPMRRNRRCSTGCWWPWDAPPTATPSMPPRPASRSSARGIIAVDKQMRTNVPHIFAIGDIVGAPMLAHKATHEAKVAAEVAAGQKSAFDARCIPSVAYTDPEIAWVGVTETEAKARGIEYGKGMFPWAASGRSLGAQSRRGVHQAAVRQDRRIASSAQASSAPTPAS